jgi:Carboxypeptidase regulatory-like domain
LVRTRHTANPQQTTLPVSTQRTASLLAKGFRVAALRIGALILSVTAAFGQMNTGEIGGNVKDSSGGWVPGATVVAEQPATRLKYTAVVNNSGEYLLPQLPIGTYKLTVDALGFKQSVLSNLEVHIGTSSGTSLLWKSAIGMR